MTIGHESITVQEALSRIANRQLRMPAIQREFVWRQSQIEDLFDSLMRDFPIGSFLFWEVDPETAKHFQFYGFITEFHRRDRAHAPKDYPMPGRPLTAVLDGQQRLTAIQIGLRGSFAEKLPRLWWSSDDAFPVSRLYLDLSAGSTWTGDDDEKRHAFAFLTDEVVTAEPGRWFLCSDVVGLLDEAAVMEEADRRGLDAEHPGTEALLRLFRAVHVHEHIWAFTEESQDADKVLEIFVRMNSGGTPLSKSDLLMSMATNQWSGDARTMVNDLVVRLNGPEREPVFHFSRDLVLKAALYLSSAPDFRFRLSNFTRANMAAMEEDWAAIGRDLFTARELLRSFGFHGQHLPSDSVLLPLALYVRARGLGGNYLTLTNHGADRAEVKLWVTRALMKRGVWGGSPDTLLGNLRAVLRAEAGSGFPRMLIEERMAAIGRSLAFDGVEIEALLDLKIGDRRSYAVLATLFGTDDTAPMHVDHIFPHVHMTEAQLRQAGVVDDEEVHACLAGTDRLANLQLLDGAMNTSKQARAPREWLEKHFTQSDREQFIQRNLLGDVPADLSGFLTFCEARKEAMRQRL